MLLLCFVSGMAQGDPVLQAALTAVVNDVALKYNITYTAAVVSGTYEVGYVSHDVLYVGGVNVTNIQPSFLHWQPKQRNLHFSIVTVPFLSQSLQSTGTTRRLCAVQHFFFCSLFITL